VDAEALLRHLADGRPRSGEALARTFGVTRAAVWKHVRRIKGWGVTVTGTAGHGYRVEGPLDLLDRDAMMRALAARSVGNVARIDLLWEHESTNQYLQDRPAPMPGEVHVCLAEYQSAGRGRRGRSWTAPLGTGLCLSAAWRFADVPRGLSALPLAVGVAARRAILSTTGVAVLLKWPNDLVFAERKLGGILVELSVEAHGACHVVAGLGINVAMPTELLASIASWPGGAVDLRTAARGEAPSRAALAAALVGELAALFAAFARTGFDPYRDEWNAADFLAGRAVEVEQADGTVQGTACGVAPDGSLLLEVAGGVEHRIVSGDVTVRPCA
jgi:BirA family biotin operon repressor/biotin-[acetyl-CoA-carboxylase] ligase